MTDKEEREAIVRWLREGADAQNERALGNSSLYLLHTLAAEKRSLASAIERGEHHKG